MKKAAGDVVPLASAYIHGVGRTQLLVEDNDKNTVGVRDYLVLKIYEAM